VIGALSKTQDVIECCNLDNPLGGGGTIAKRLLQADSAQHRNRGTLVRQDVFQAALEVPINL
jgi:hypothetical protein